MIFNSLSPAKTGFCIWFRGRCYYVMLRNIIFSFAAQNLS
jgi:hypothetical protein